MKREGGGLEGPEIWGYQKSEVETRQQKGRNQRNGRNEREACRGQALAFPMTQVSLRQPNT
jgi:hypothetical protein